MTLEQIKDMAHSKNLDAEFIKMVTHCTEALVDLAIEVRDANKEGYDMPTPILYALGNLKNLINKI